MTHRKSRAARKGKSSWLGGNDSYPILGRQTSHDKRRLFHAGIAISAQHANPFDQRFEKNQTDQHHQSCRNRRVETVIEDEARSSRGGWTEFQGSSLRQKTDAGIGIKYLVPRGRKGHCNQPNQRQQRNRGVTSFVHFDDDGSSDT